MEYKTWEIAETDYKHGLTFMHDQVIIINMVCILKLGISTVLYASMHIIIISY